MATDKPATKTEPVKSAPAAKAVATPAAPVKAEAKAAEPVKAPAPAAPKAEAAKPEPVKSAAKPAEPVKVEAPKQADPVKAEAPRAAALAKKKAAAAKPAAKPTTAAAPVKTPAAAVAVAAPAEIVDIQAALAYPRDTFAIFSEMSSEAADVAVGLNEMFAGYVAMSFDLGVRHVEAVTGSRSFEDIYAANSDLIEAEFDAWLASSIATIEAGTRFVDKLSAPVEARLKKYSDEMLERMAG